MAGQWSAVTAQEFASKFNRIPAVSACAAGDENTSGRGIAAAAELALDGGGVKNAALLLTVCVGLGGWDD